ncbi:ABC transporter ATP-binding protein [uncultured Secundilactobacillus sp.]|uniref:ABC transporter ATP-binding protein n=1 Tax=uncultured Secundilactobacillus sp. TaxID=2813935 RepID=UPI002589CA16|nr:ATP-binding cassette domain-containing protein [uncultured Secundilactobacillus sp.]
MLQIEHVSKIFGSKSAVSDLSFNIKKGEIIGIIGQNGAGKSTTFHMILGFTPTDEGRILWKGKKITQNNRPSVGYMPEERGLYMKESIRSQIFYFAALQGMEKSVASKKLEWWMKKLNVIGKPTDKIESLSKGNAQKVQLLACLMFEPELLILDEPFSGLDPVNAELLIKAILEAKSRGAMIIFSSHNMNNVERLSDYLVMIHHGNTLLKGTPTEIFKSYGRLKLELDGWNNFDFLSQHRGVSNILKQPSGAVSADLLNEEEGRILFNVISKKGYIPVFNQHYPSLEDIFKLEVQKNEQH